MVFPYRKGLPKLAKEVLAIPRSVDVPFRTNRGEVVGTKKIDSRSPQWAAIKECIESIDLRYPVVLRLSLESNLYSSPPRYCRDCNISIFQFIFSQLKVRFGITENEIDHRWGGTLSPAAEVVCFLDTILRNPIESECPLGHAFETGAFILHVTYEFRDAWFEIDYKLPIAV
jgi:hypothetical protein